MLRSRVPRAVKAGWSLFVYVVYAMDEGGTPTMAAHRLIVPILGSMALTLAPALLGQSDGETIYKRQCAMCHAADGSGNTGMGKTFKLRDLKSADVQKMTDAQLTEIISKGKGKMPAYAANLGPEKIKSVVAYLRQMAKGK